VCTPAGRGDTPRTSHVHTLLAGSHTSPAGFPQVSRGSPHRSQLVRTPIGRDSFTIGARATPVSTGAHTGPDAHLDRQEGSPHLSRWVCLHLGLANDSDAPLVLPVALMKPPSATMAGSRARDERSCRASMLPVRTMTLSLAPLSRSNASGNQCGPAHTRSGETPEPSSTLVNPARRPEKRSSAPCKRSGAPVEPSHAPRNRSSATEERSDTPAEREGRARGALGRAS